jgi:GNAT superfamily N-acetyltransferase
VIDVRRGVPSDARELVRLRTLMLGSMGGQPAPPGPWQETAADSFREGLADGGSSMAAFVVDPPGAPGTLAACAVGLIVGRLPSPANPGGEAGYILNVATDDGYRRRGYSRACVAALLDWYASRNITVIELKATPAGEPLYSSLGFHADGTAMRLTRRSAPTAPL